VQVIGRRTCEFALNSKSLQVLHDRITVRPVVIVYLIANGRYNQYFS
jgi:hypothetical protein